jgi:LPXTG-motif cell wall-anchored protein
VSPVEERGVKGEVETHGAIPTVPAQEELQTAPATLFQADTSQTSGTLPLTGFNALFQVILGGLSLAGGGLLFRRTRVL